MGSSDQNSVFEKLGLYKNVSFELATNSRDFIEVLAKNISKSNGLDFLSHDGKFRGYVKRNSFLLYKHQAVGAQNLAYSQGRFDESGDIINIVLEVYIPPGTIFIFLFFPILINVVAFFTFLPHFQSVKYAILTGQLVLMCFFILGLYLSFKKHVRELSHDVERTFRIWF